MTTKTYVEYLMPGVFFPEESTEKVSTRDIKDLKIPKNCYAFRFFDMTETIQDGELLRGRAKNYSGYYFIDGTVYTLDEIKQYFPADTILALNIKNTESKKGIYCRTGNWQPFEKGSTQVSADGEVLQKA